MIEISHLVVDGCSLAYCQGLENPHIDGWPALLAKKIGVPVVNLAIGGSAMESIHRRQYDYVYKSKASVEQNNAKPFYLISLTWAGRREAFFESYYNHYEREKYYGYDLRPDVHKLLDIISTGDRNPESYAAYLEYSYFFNMNLRMEHLKKLQLWASLVNLYKTNNYNYCFGDYMPTWDGDIQEFYKNNYLDLQKNLYDDPNYYGDYSYVTHAMPKLPCGHDTVEAQIALADYIYNKMIEVHKEIIVRKVNSVYNLHDYYSTNQYERFAQFSDWKKV